MNELGHICEIVRYPVKSMAGIITESAFLGWHGLDGDRRFGFRRLGDDSGFPWLTASRVPELLLYHPFGHDQSTDEPLPTHVRTPDGTNVELREAELRNQIAERFGSSVELMKVKHGIFDDGSARIGNVRTILKLRLYIGRSIGGCVAGNDDARSLIQAWRTNHRATVFLIRNLPATIWSS